MIQIGSSGSKSEDTLPKEEEKVHVKQVTRTGKQSQGLENKCVVQEHPTLQSRITGSDQVLAGILQGQSKLGYGGVRLASGKRNCSKTRNSVVARATGSRLDQGVTEKHTDEPRYIDERK
jgi:hypothetical protein